MNAPQLNLVYPFLYCLNKKQFHKRVKLHQYEIHVSKLRIIIHIYVCLNEKLNTLTSEEQADEGKGT